MFRKQNKKILAEVGCLIFSMLTLTAIINGIYIYRSSSKNYIDMLSRQTEDILFQTRECLTEYASLPWLIGYWRDHSAELELPGDAAARSAAVKQKLLECGAEDLQSVTPKQADAFSDREQRLYAEACYLAVMPRLYEMKKNFDLTSITCVTMLDRETARPLFQALAEGELTSYGNFCALGEVWPFNAALHPAFDEMYGERTDRVYFEQVVSTSNGVEYLFGYVPVMIDGEIACHLNVYLAMSGLRQVIAANTSAIERVNGMLLLLSAALLLLLIRQRILRPLSGVQQAVRKFRDDKETAAVVQAMTGIRSANEVGRLAHDISDMAVELKKYSTDMARLSAEKERIGAELSMATRIQANMLPNTFPAFPERREFELYASMTPAKEVGGDFYDFFLVDDDHLAMVVADVSGKGVPAALFMMTSRTMLKDAALTGLDPARSLKRVNARLCENNRDCMFVTVWLGVLEISTGTLTYADAGHEKLLAYRDGVWSFLPKACPPALAFAEPEELDEMPEQYQFRNETIRLKPGDVLLQYTDGVTEATYDVNAGENAVEAMFGEKRLLDAVNELGGAGPEELLKHIRARIDEFVDGGEQFDDITMLGLRYRGVK